MLLTKWAERRSKEPDCKGVYAELERDARLNHRTVVKAARDGKPVSYEVAEKLSLATKGECSIDEIRFPDRYKALPEKKHKRSLPPSAA